jgi:hypothetical protein
MRGDNIPSAPPSPRRIRAVEAWTVAGLIERDLGTAEAAQLVADLELGDGRDKDTARLIAALLARLERTIAGYEQALREAKLERR